MSEFKKYRRSKIAELREITELDIIAFKYDDSPHSPQDTEFPVSISGSDLASGSPKIGDMVARNPRNHEDQWLVAKQYFQDNFEELEPDTSFIGRLETETEDLKHKIDKLGDFINNNPAFKNVTESQQLLLRAQYNSMAGYYFILRMRLEDLKG